MKASKKVQEISKTLASSGIDAAGKEALLLVMTGLDIGSVDLYRDDPEIDTRQMLRIDEMVKRRSTREPLQYILGHSEFLGLRFVIGAGALIPRPETELLAEHAIKVLSNQQSALSVKRNKDNAASSGVTILDLCTGSGCLAIALAREFPDARVTGSDVSQSALEYAKKNAGIHGVHNVSFLKGHLFAPLDTDCAFDLIVSNPPYIKTNDIKTLQEEIRLWEPVHALDGGGDGLDFYREIIPGAGKFLKEHGILMLELGAGQADDVASLLKSGGYSDIKFIDDYAGIKRIAQATWIN
jgi:release factor glutamine methyltransferase